MSFITWVLILSGVGPECVGPICLLKVATRPLAHFTNFGIQTLIDSIGILCRSPQFWAGMVCYATSLCVWLAALVQGAGEHGLSDVVSGLHRGGLHFGGCGWAKPCRRLR